MVLFDDVIEVFDAPPLAVARQDFLIE
jgi:hypothetical protein